MSVAFLSVPDQDAADLKFRAGELHGLDNTKPENYKWYEEHQKEGNFTLYKLGPEMNSQFFWFNLNKVQPPLPGEKLPSGRKVGDPFVDPVKYAWFSNPVFRRAVSMAVDRDAMIPASFFGHAVKNWSTTSAGNKVWYRAGPGALRLQPGGVEEAARGLGWKDSDGDGVLEDTHGHPDQLRDEDQRRQQDARRHGELHQGRSGEGGHQDDARAGRLQHAHHQPAPDFQYDSILLGLQSGVPPEPDERPERVALERPHALMEHQAAEARDRRKEAQIDQLIDENSPPTTIWTRQKAWQGNPDDRQRAGLDHLAADSRLQVPISNKFGNLQPSIMAHRLLWNIERVYVKEAARP